MTPALRINFEEAPDFSTPIPTDRYTLVIADAKPAKAAKSGAMRKLIGFQVKGGEFNGRYVWVGYMLEGPGAGFFRDLLKGIGLDPEEVAALTDEDDLNGMLVGSELEAQGGVGTNQDGDPTNEIEKIFAAQSA